MADRNDTLPLNALRAFCEVARFKHVTRAADSLKVSQSAISRHVSQLERFMGAPLLERQGRNIVLTEIGRQLADAIGGPLDDIAFSVQLMRRRRSGPRRLIVRTSLPTLAFTTLIPRLPEFSKLHDDTPIDVLTSVTTQDLYGDFDVLISRDLALPSPMREWQIAEERIVCVGAPGILRDTPELNYRENKICIVTSRPDILPAWLNYMGIQEETVRLGARYDHHYMAIPAIVAGGGLLIAPEIVVSDYVQKKLLVIVEGSRAPTGMIYSAFANDRSPLPDLAAAFCRWVARIYKKEGA